MQAMERASGHLPPPNRQREDDRLEPQFGDTSCSDQGDELVYEEEEIKLGLTNQALDSSVDIVPNISMDSDNLEYAELDKIESNENFDKNQEDQPEKIEENRSSELNDSKSHYNQDESNRSDDQTVKYSKIEEISCIMDKEDDSNVSLMNSSNGSKISTDGPTNANIYLDKSDKNAIVSENLPDCNDSLSVEHSNLIMEALTKINELSEQINEKDCEYQVAQNKLETYVSEFDEQLHTLLVDIGHPVDRCRKYFEEKRSVKEMFEVANRLARDLKLYGESQEEMQAQLGQLEEALSAKKNAKELDDPSYASLLFQVNGVIGEIEDLANNQRSIREMYEKYMSALKKSQFYLLQKEKIMPRTIAKASPYFELQNTMMQGLIEHRSRIEKISHEKAQLRYQYKSSLTAIDNLGMRIEIENKNASKC